MIPSQETEIKLQFVSEVNRADESNIEAKYSDVKPTN
jgi:hypothetical protein